MIPWFSSNTLSKWATLCFSSPNAHWTSDLLLFSHSRVRKKYRVAPVLPCCFFPVGWRRDAHKRLIVHQLLKGKDTVFSCGLGFDQTPESMERVAKRKAEWMSKRMPPFGMRVSTWLSTRPFFLCAKDKMILQREFFFLPSFPLFP